MGKRRAGNELTRDNWDDEEEKVEAGKFQMADESVLKNRVVRKAKRTIQRDESSEIKPIFSGFSGFNKLNSNTDSKQAFSFLTKRSEIPSESGNHPSTSTINSVSTSSSLKCSETHFSKSSSPTVIDPMKIMKLNEAFVKFVTEAVQKNPYCVLTPTLKDYEKQVGKFVTVTNCNTNTSDSSLTSLKESPQISSFENMETHTKNKDEVKNNSINIQTSVTSFAEPISSSLNTSNNGFKFGNNSPGINANESSNNLKLDKADEKETKEEKCEEPKLQSVEESKSTPTVTSGFKLGDFKFNSPPFTTSLTNNSPGFRFGDTEKTSSQSIPLETKFNPTPLFSFGTGASAPTYSFKSTEQNVNKPFFGFVSTTSTKTPTSDSSKNDEPQKSKDEEDDEDQPPVVNFAPIKENDAIFESKSKLYYFENGKYEEHGIGQLYLKPIDEKKIQLIMRNDSALGTIMVNTLLNDSVKFTKRNPKNVQLICVVDPTKSTKPQTVLFKFKDPQTTDAFENELAKLKK